MKNRLVTIILAVLFLIMPATAHGKIIHPFGAVIYTANEITEQYREKYRYLYPQDEVDWNWKCFEESPIEIVSETVYQMVYLGVPENIFDCLEIKVFPVYGIKSEMYNPNIQNRHDNIIGVTLNDREIWIVARAAKDSLAHEIGHIVHNRMLDTDGYHWSKSNEIAEEYMKIKGYPKKRKLTGIYQSFLPWEERIAEWFAEDFSWYAGYRSIEEHRAGPKPTEEVREFFDKLFDNKSIFSSMQN